MKTIKLACTAAVVAGLAVAGCGGGGGSSSSTASLSSFKTGFSADKAVFKALGVDLGTAISGAASKTDAQLATQFSALASRAAQQAKTIGKLNPPAKYKTQVGTLVVAFNATAADLTAISAAAAAHNVTAAEAATKKLLVDAAKVKSSDDSISKALGLSTT